MKLYFTLLNMILSTIMMAQTLNDMDNDGMTDEWEILNNLDPTDPNDAFGDPDGDYILNLQEHILTLDPNNDNSDLIYEHGPNDPIQNIQNRVMAAANEVVVIRLSESSQVFSVFGFAMGNFRFMLQGGWNADFTEYDPCKYPTVLEHNGGSPGTISFGGPGAAYMGIVLDGVELRNGGGLVGAVELIADGSPIQVHAHNTVFEGAVAYGLNVSGRFGTPTVDVTVSSSLFYDNAFAGITIATDGEPEVTARVINCTLDSPGSTAGGIEFRTIGAGETRANAYITNSILWNNGSSGPFSNIGASVGVVVETDHCVLPPSAPSPNLIQNNSFTVAPVFVDRDNGDFTLESNSPYVDAGLDRGLPFVGAGIDLGAAELGGCGISSTNQVAGLEVTAFPNPVVSELQLQFNSTDNYTIEIHNIDGQRIYKGLVQGGNKRLEFENYIPGAYFLQIKNSKTSQIIEHFKVVKI